MIGVTMRLWTVEDGEAPRHHRRCCSVEDTDDAKAAADVLGIRHYVLNMEREFAEGVVDRFVSEYGASEDEAKLLTRSREIASYFEAAAQCLIALNPAGRPISGDARQWYGRSIAKGVAGLLAPQLNRTDIEISSSPVTPAQFAVLHARMFQEVVTSKSAREIFLDLWESPQPNESAIDAIIDAKGLKQVANADELAKIVDQVVAANPKSVEEYRAGKQKAFNALVGQVMKATKGKANPALVNEILKRMLAD